MSMSYLCSSVGRKLLTGVTGLALVAFLIVHLLGNFTLFGGPDMFNSYAHFLENVGHGVVIYAAEAGLILIFVLHIVTTLQVRASKAKARSQGYVVSGDAGGASRKTSSSMYMALTGSLLLAFVVLHVMHFKYGPKDMVMLHGEEVKDLYSLVVSEFKSFPMVVLYVTAMAMLGMHLRHGVWSALQSLALTKPSLSRPLYVGGAAFGVVLAVGFLLLPLIIFFFFEAP